MGYYAFADTTQTYAQGGQVRAVATEAATACQAVAEAASSVLTGSSTVQAALGDFEGDVNTARGELSAEIEGLGASTQETAVTGQQASNEGVGLQNTTGSIAQRVNGTHHTSIQAV